MKFVTKIILSKISLLLFFLFHFFSIQNKFPVYISARKMNTTIVDVRVKFDL